LFREVRLEINDRPLGDMPSSLRKHSVFPMGGLAFRAAFAGSLCMNAPGREGPRNAH
jgi:hypothetical protein